MIDPSFESAEKNILLWSFDSPLQTAELIRRYKRFLADVRLEDGTILQIHCPNSGSMLSCMPAGALVAFSQADNPQRKLPHTWEMVRIGRTWVVVNTMLPNKMAARAILQNGIPSLGGYDTLRTEVPYGTRSRIDILLESPKKRCFVEVKNVTLRRQKDLAEFPDAKTARGLKHLNDLAAEVRKGHRAVMLYIVNRSDVRRFHLAEDIDPLYVRAARDAQDVGVEFLIYRTEASLENIRLIGRIPWEESF